MEMLPESKSAKIYLFDEPGYIKPHGKVSDHCGRNDDDHIQKQVFLFFDKEKHQNYADQFTGRIFRHSILKLLHSREKPGDIKHSREQSHCEDKIDRLILRRQGNKYEPDYYANR